MVVIGIGVELGGIIEVEDLVRDLWGHIKVGDGGGVKGRTGGSRHGGPLRRGTREQKRLGHRPGMEEGEA